MAAPTGVNEELPGEPAKAGRAGAELAEPQAAEAETSGTLKGSRLLRTVSSSTPRILAKCGVWSRPSRKTLR